MHKKISLAALALLVLASSVFSQSIDFIKAGGWEYSGSFMFVHRPNYPLFASGVPEEDRGDFLQTVDLAANIGKFLADGFSLSLRPSLFYYKSRTLNSSLEKSTQKTLILGLGSEAAFYRSLGANFLLSLGGELGLGIQPGLKELSDDVEDPDKGFSMNFWLEPKVRGYYLLSEGFAPFAELGWKIMYNWRIKDSDGSSHTYPADYSFFDDVFSRFTFTLGLKYFLPQGGRFEVKPENTFNDILDKGFGS